MAAVAAAVAVAVGVAARAGVRGGGSRFVRAALAIDPRSLAAFRATFGALVLADLATRAPWIADHDTDAGVMPRAALAQWLPSAHHFCVHAWAGSLGYERALFAVAAVLAVFFALGRGGAVVTVLLWILTASLQSRNPMVLNKGDQILRLMLFWSMFLPARAAAPVVSAGGAGLLVQAALVWLVSACLKTDRSWFPDGTATYIALQMDHGVTPFGRFLGAHAGATRVLTYGVYFLEWAAAPLLLSPVRTGATRAIAIAALTAMHVGFGLSLRLGLFPAASIGSLVAFLPGAFWDGLGVRSPAGGPVPAPAVGLARASTGLALVALALVLGINVAAVSGRRLPALVDAVAHLSRLDQNWAMFAPYPDRASGWFVIDGHLPDGREVDAYHPALAASGFAEPENLSATFPSARWLYFMTNLAKPEYAFDLPAFGRYACRRFDAAHLAPAPLADIAIAYVRRWTLDVGHKTEPETTWLWRGRCDAKN